MPSQASAATSSSPQGDFNVTIHHCLDKYGDHLIAAEYTDSNGEVIQHRPLGLEFTTKLKDNMSELEASDGKCTLTKEVPGRMTDRNRVWKTISAHIDKFNEAVQEAQERDKKTGGVSQETTNLEVYRSSIKTYLDKLHEADRKTYTWWDSNGNAIAQTGLCWTCPPTRSEVEWLQAGDIRSRIKARGHGAEFCYQILRAKLGSDTETEQSRLNASLNALQEAGDSIFTSQMAAKRLESVNSLQPINKALMKDLQDRLTKTKLSEPTKGPFNELMNGVCSTYVGSEDPLCPLILAAITKHKGKTDSAPFINRYSLEQSAKPPLQLGHKLQGEAALLNDTLQSALTIRKQLTDSLQSLMRGDQKLSTELFHELTEKAQTFSVCRDILSLVSHEQTQSKAQYMEAHKRETTACSQRLDPAMSGKNLGSLSTAVWDWRAVHPRRMDPTPYHEYSKSVFDSLPTLFTLTGARDEALLLENQMFSKISKTYDDLSTRATSFNALCNGAEEKIKASHPNFNGTVQSLVSCLTNNKTAGK